MHNPPRDASPLYPEQPRCDPLLRIGLLLDEPAVPAWIARVVDEIQHSGFCRIALVVVDADGRRECNGGFSEFLYHAYVRNEIRRRRGPRSPFVKRDLTPVLADAVWMRVTPRHHQDRLCAAAADLDRIRQEQLDVLLRFGWKGELCADLVSASRHGVWMYAHSNTPEAGSDSNLLWAIHRRNPASTSELWQLPPSMEAPRLLYRSYGSTHPHSLELAQQAMCCKSSTFMMRCLRQLAENGEIRFEQVQVLDGHRSHGTLAMGDFLVRNLARRTRALIRKRTSVEYWSVLWRRSRQPLDPQSPSFEGAQALPCPHGHFYADPFLFRHRGEEWLFLEDYDYARKYASIVAIPWGEQGAAGPARTALELTEHLSYPHVFEWKGDAYMVPEIGSTGGPVRLFRARHFPDDWEVVCDLISGHRAADATLHEHRGHWYLFVNITEAGGNENDELFLFHADTPLGPFKPHPQNPVVSDVRRARSAGRIFTHRGRLIRPSQDCAGGYGRAVVFNEILELDPQRYRETSIGRLAPSSLGAIWGCHTYAQLGDLEVIDVKQLKMRWRVGA